MSEIRLTKDATSLLKAMHKEYKRRRKNGENKQEAAVFGDSAEIKQRIMPEWSIEDINLACYELQNAELLNCIFGDDDIQIGVLTNPGIEYAESRFVDAAKAVWNLLKELIPFIPTDY